MDAEIRGYFEAEAKELIDRLTRGVARLQGLDGEAAEAMLADALPDVLRAAHTLKGAAHVVGERGLAGRAHDFEDLAAAYRAAPTAAGAASLLAAVDGLAGAGEPKALEPKTLEPKVLGAEAGMAAPARAVAGQAAQAVGKTASAARRTVRVDVAHAMALLGGLEESGVLLGTMRGMLTEWEALATGRGRDAGSASQGGSQTNGEQARVRRDDLRRQMFDQQERLERNMRGLQAAGAHLRLAAAETLLLEAGRTVRATAAAVGKQVKFVGRSGDERLEVQLQDALQDALLHLLRNAVAHGVESAAERAAAGKSAEAALEVSVARAGRFIEVRCADDGRGIALEPLRARAQALGLAVPEAKQEVLALLLRPGFNQGGPVTEVSGRGVGMDAVREAMERVAGSVEIESEVGRGTTFTLRVPQSLFALQALEVMAGGRMFALPLAQIEQTFRMERHHTDQVQASGSLPMGPRMISYVRLDEAFPARAREVAWLEPALPESSGRHQTQNRQTQDSANGICVVLKAGNERLGCGVDRLLGVGEVLVRPVSAAARVGPQVAGTALSANGVPYLVVHASELLRRVQADRVQADRGRRPADAAAKRSGKSTNKRKPILVIDDSLTTRMLEQSILETEGYEVELAHSAEQGLAMARQKEYAMFLVDVEMPGMNGFEFVSLVSKDAQLQATPAMLVTSLDSAEHRERGRAAGAVSYVVKGEFNQQIYLDRIRAVVGRSA